jgi:hypothetical protein
MENLKPLVKRIIFKNYNIGQLSVTDNTEKSTMAVWIKLVTDHCIILT